MTAFIVGKWYRVDLRQQKSRNLGARNAGRVLGRLAFVITLLGDALKGILVIILGQVMDFEQWILAIGMLFVIVGHLYPVFLSFHGGKGVATFIGAGLYLEPILFIWMIVGTLLLFIFVRNLTVGMLGGFTLYIASIIWEGNMHTYSGVILSICLIIWKHRSNLSRINGLSNQ
ncbi:glycerol-3-phosphate acyltransferase [Lysinibacillus sp. SGAir0095]|nr:glycerol-3-phosphate acyltransferase [Lysinibacillus sp. SGAir0095]